MRINRERDKLIKRKLHINITRIWDSKPNNNTVIKKADIWVFRDGICNVINRSIRIYSMESEEGDGSPLK